MEELRESLKHLKETVADVKAALYKKKLVQTALAFQPTSERPKIVTVNIQQETDEQWLDRELKRLAKENPEEPSSLGKTQLKTYSKKKYPANPAEPQKWSPEEH